MANSPSTWQYEPGDTIDLAYLDRVRNNLYADHVWDSNGSLYPGHPASFYLNIVGKVLSFPFERDPTTGQYRTYPGIGTRDYDYDIADVPSEKMSLGEMELWQPDEITFTARDGVSLAPLRSYDFADWTAVLDQSFTYDQITDHIAYPLTGQAEQSITAGSRRYDMVNYFDHSTLSVSIPTNARAVGVNLTYKRSRFYKKAAYYYYPLPGEYYGKKFFYDGVPYYGRIDGYRFYVFEWDYVTAYVQARPAFSSFFVAAHWKVALTAPPTPPATSPVTMPVAVPPGGGVPVITVNEGDPRWLALALSAPLSTFTLNDLTLSGEVFLVQGQAPNTDGTYSFADDQEEFLEYLTSGPVNGSVFTFEVHSATSASISPAIMVLGTPAAGAIFYRYGAIGVIPYLNQALGTPYVQRFRFQYATRQRRAGARIGEQSYTFNSLIFDDGPLSLDVTVLPRGSGSGPPGSGPRDAGEEQDLAQDVATGRVSRVSSDGTTLSVQAWEGWANLSPPPSKPSALILDNQGKTVTGHVPSLFKVSEEGRYSLCYQSGKGSVIRGDSRDNLTSLEAFHVVIFQNPNGSPKTGGLPCHIRDNSTGIWYVAASFPTLDSLGHPVSGQEDVLIARLDALDTVLSWADDTTSKSIAAGIAAAGKPSLTQNRYDPEQPLFLLHGDKKYLGTEGGEIWSEIT